MRQPKLLERWDGGTGNYFNEESQIFKDELSGGDSTATGPMKIGRSVDIFAAGLIFTLF